MNRHKRRKGFTAPKKKGWRGTLALVTFVGVVHLATAPVLAQAPGRLPGEDSGVWQWVVGLGLVAVVVAASFINPKRTHQG